MSRIVNFSHDLIMTVCKAYITSKLDFINLKYGTEAKGKEGKRKDDNSLIMMIM